LGTTARYIESNQDAQRQPSGSCLSRLQIVYFVFPLLDPSAGVTARQEGTINVNPTQTGSSTVLREQADSDPGMQRVPHRIAEWIA
jgi:hypothetical protein